MDWGFAVVDNIDTAKRKALILKVLKSIVFASLLGLLFLYNVNRPRIMIVHSYDPTMDIVKDFDNGVKKALENEIEPLIQSYYLNMLNKNTIKQKIDAGIEARVSVDRFNPKILIAIGDEAQEFVAKFYLDKKKTKVIFAGVKGDFKKFGYIPGQNVGGIIEIPQIQELNTLINSMLPEKKDIRLAHLGDQSTIVNLTERTLIQHSWQNIRFQDSVRVIDADNFKKAAILLSKRCDVLLISSYKGLKVNPNSEDEVISDEVMKWIIENTSVPIISTLGYAVEEGAGAAIVSSAYEQGMLAMNAGLTMLNIKSRLTSVTSKVFAVYLNDTHIKERNLHIPPIYQSFAVGTQKLYGHHKLEASL